MKDEQKTKKQLIEELAEMRRQIAGLESSPGKQGKSEAEPNESARATTDLAEEQGMLLQYARDFVYRHDSRGVFAYISPSVETITGYKVEEWLRHYTTYLTDNPINENVIAYTDETLQTGKAIPPYLAEIRHKDGRKIMLEVNEQPYFKDGKVAGIIGVARDITERKRAEEKLREAYDKLEIRVRERTSELEAINKQLHREISERRQAEEQLRIMHSAVESSVNAIALCDLKGNFTYVNESFLALWGYDKTDEVVGKPCRAFWEDAEKAAEIYHKIKRMESWAGELTARRKDGLMFDVHLSANAVVNEEGNPIQLMASFIDVTERRRAEEALRESERKYRVLFDEAADLIAIIDIEGHLLNVNKRFEEESGWSREEMTGKNVFTLELLTEPSVAKARYHLSRLLSGDEPPIFEIEGISRSGEIVPYELRATPIRRDGKTVAVQAILRNITERRQSEEKIIAMAYYDALTELPNRYLFKDRLKQAIIAAKQYKRLLV